MAEGAIDSATLDVAAVSLHNVDMSHASIVSERRHPARSKPGLFALILAAGLGATPAAAETYWYSIFSAEGNRIGHSSEQVITGADGRGFIDSREILLREADGRPTPVKSWTVVKQDSHGRTIAVSETRQTGRTMVRTEAQIRDGVAHVTRHADREKRQETVTLPPNVRFDGGRGLLPGWNPVETPRLEFESFDLGAMEVEQVVIEPLAAEAASDGGHLLLRRRYQQGQLRAVARLQVDTAGRIVEMIQPIFGSTLRIRASDREAALQPPEPHSLLSATMMNSPYRISPEALQGRIRYSFTFRDNLIFAPPESAEQRVTLSGQELVIDICEACGPGLLSDKAQLAEALRPTPWLQSDDARLRALAEPVARQKISEREKMEALARRARPFIQEIDFIGHYSALETLSRRSGDCTEAAVLLAALGRAAGIPTRVASGLVYSRERYHGKSNVFFPHSWTLAFVDGGWRSFDPSLETFDSSHILLTIGDGDPRSIGAANQLAGLLEWQSMREIRPAKPN